MAKKKQAKRLPTLEEDLTEKFTSEFDRRTLEAGISKRAAATIAANIADEFEMRATGLLEEARDEPDEDDD